MTILENGNLIINTKAEGAELTSIVTKSNNLNYLWNGDPAFWGRHSPVLFPIVGRLIENKYLVNNKEYELSQHGFARDMHFELVHKTNNELTYELKSNEETLSKFPFQFTLATKYKIEDQTVYITYEVINNDKVTMPFSIGAHPAFNVPLIDQEEFEDYFLQFETEEKIEAIKLEGPYRNGKKVLIASNLKELPLTRELFIDDAIILENLNKNVISIRSKKNNHYVKVTFEGFPYVGIWTTNSAPFVCIEPWYGLADEIGPIKEMKDRLGVLSIEPGEAFTCTYSITVGNE